MATTHIISYVLKVQQVLWRDGHSQTSLNRQSWSRPWGSYTSHLLPLLQLSALPLPLPIHEGLLSGPLAVPLRWDKRTAQYPCML